LEIDHYESRKIRETIGRISGVCPGSASSRAAVGKDAKVAAITTRAPKQHIPQEVLLAGWQREAAVLGITKEYGEGLLGKAHSNEKAQDFNEPLNDQEKLFDMWWETAAKAGWNGAKIEELLGTVTSKGKSQASPGVERKNPLIENLKDAVTGRPSGDDHCISWDDWLRKGKEQLRREKLKSRLKVIRGGAKLSNGKDEPDQRHEKKQGFLKLIRDTEGQSQRQSKFADEKKRNQSFKSSAKARCEENKKEEKENEQRNQKTESKQSSNCFEEKNKKRRGHRKHAKHQERAKRRPHRERPHSRNEPVPLKAFKRALRKPQTEFIPKTKRGKESRRSPLLSGPGMESKRQTFLRPSTT